VLVFTYFLRRLLYTIPVLWGVVTVVLILMVSFQEILRAHDGAARRPRDAGADYADLGLDLPLHRQYTKFLGELLRGDLGTSYRSNEKVSVALSVRFGATLRLAFWAMVVASVLGVTAGIVSAVKQYSVFDYSAMFLAISGVSAPVFWVGLLLLLAFAYNLHWIPGVGYGDGQAIYLILPVLTLGVRPAALIARLTRSCMLEVLSQDYIRTARAKGLADKIVVIKHALKNALIPVVTSSELRWRNCSPGRCSRRRSSLGQA
jgi:peptide/nickel transport system permease protein